MTDKDGPLFDFGKMTASDLQRVAKQLRTDQYAPLDQGIELQQAAQLGMLFVAFLIETFTSLGLLDKWGIAQARETVALPYDEAEPVETLITRMWNNRAIDWGVVESPTNYRMSMQTLMEHFKFLGNNRMETILSLGSGPGFYETFLGGYLMDPRMQSKSKIICVDAANEMVKKHKQVLKSAYWISGRTRYRVKNVEPTTGDMTNLKFDANSVSQIICNNSLQWVPTWQKAVDEMSRVMDPKGLGRLYLFVHNHPMSVRKATGEVMFKVGATQVPDLLDYMETRNFRISFIRQLRGQKGLGQFGGNINRTFILAEYNEGDFTSWRKAKVQAALNSWTPTGTVPKRIV